MLHQRGRSQRRGPERARQLGNSGEGRSAKPRRGVVPAYESLEFRSLLSVAALYGFDNLNRPVLTFQEQGAPGPDQLAVRLSGGLVQYTLNGGAPSTTFTLPGGGGPRSFSISQVATITVSLGQGDDSLLIDHSAGLVKPLSGITFDGGANTALSPSETFDGADGDRLIVAGSSESTTLTNARFVGASSGTVTLIGVEKASLSDGNGTHVLDARGFSGPTKISGGNASDTIYGGSGNDLITSGNSGTVADGGAGDDTLIGGNGKDSLNGGPGNDFLSGGGGVDTLDGGDRRRHLAGRLGQRRPERRRRGRHGGRVGRRQLHPDRHHADGPGDRLPLLDRAARD